MSTTTTPKTWLITGSSSGFGLLLARSILAHGDNVIATSRNPSRTPDLINEIESTPRGKWLTLDVTSPAATIASVIHDAASLFGTIDVLINNAGYSVLGAAEEIPEAQAKAQFEVNFWGLIRVTQAVLPLMRANSNGGTVVNVSSVGGLAALPTCAIYAGSKFAVEAWSEALAQEVAAFGVRVLIVEPGAFRTNFLSSGAMQVQPASEVYREGVVGAVLRRFGDMDGAQKGDPAKAAERIVRNVRRGLPRGELGRIEKLRLLLGRDCVERVSKKLDELKANVEAVKGEALDVDVDE